jgi:glycosyltransferase involved in cell wall biosynthesis
MLTIGIDISQVVYETGVSVYTENLVSNLLKLKTNHKFILLGMSLRQIQKLKEIDNKFPKNHKSKFYQLPPLIWEMLSNQYRLLSVEAFTGHLDVFHSSDWCEPRSKAFKISTVHDLAPLKFADTHPRIKIVHERKLNLVKKEVDQIIAPSQFTKEELINYGFHEDKITVIPEAPNPQIKKTAGYNSTKPYFLVVGTGPRKNIPRIISAFKKFNAKNSHELIITGNSSGYSNQPNIKFLGHVSLLELSALYSGALALVYPSLYEGFGLPILEAYSCHCPVITSNISPLKETTSGAALLVNPTSVDEIAEAMVTIDSSSTKLIQKSQKVLDKFSWQNAAEQTLNLYEQNH